MMDSHCDEDRPKSSFDRKKEDSSEKLGECPAIGDLAHRSCVSVTSECTMDSECPTIQKCCFDGCSKRCLYAQKTSPCLHMQAVTELLAIQQTSQCSKDGNYQEVQCNDEFCWCAQPVSGEELEGTRVSSLAAPDCKAPRMCPSTYCSSNKRCAYGYQKDSNGCNTCECIDPCKDVECPNPGRICLPEPVDCLSKKQCPPVPKCVVNVCIVREALLVRESTLRPEFCRRSSDCPKDYYCRIVNNDNGFCCYGDAPQVNAGKCPKVADWALVQPAQRSLCELKCTEDGDCESLDQKCCFNGCGMACTYTNTSSSNDEQAAVAVVNQPSSASKGQSQPKIKKNQKIGECPKVDRLSNPELCGGESPKDICTHDQECGDNQKCCFDGCARSCLHPATTTMCLHARSAADVIARLAPSAIFQPSCDKDGAYDHIQRHNGMAWCVDSNGREIQGTKRASLMLTNCEDLIRNPCPVTSCKENCPHGFETDLLGCKQCICKDPCKDAKCPVNTVCRMTKVNCVSSGQITNSSCQPVPKCLLNVCLRGNPLENFITGELQECDELKGPKCPNGWYCHKFGLENIAYCCAGLVEQSQLLPSAQHCPSLPILFGEADSSRPSQIKCRLSQECARDEPCCFNGLGMSCLPTKQLQKPHRKSLNQAVPEVVSNWMAAVSSMECPPNVFTNPGCSSQCASNEECQAASPFMRCCGYGCGKRCLFVAKLPACVHLLAAATREVNKLADLPSSLGRPTVQCTPEGLFRRVQCDVSIRECWCVDPNSGIELVGTRYSSLTNIEPSCQIPRTCQTVCPSAKELNCEHGLRLDTNGCPLNGVCQCKNVCHDFKCSVPTEICAPRKVLCLSEPCPPIPVCLPNPCSKSSTSPSPVAPPSTCSADEHCANDQDCRFTVASGEADIDRVGICCSTCNYLSNQCDREGYCWCVDKNTGKPISGTRKFQPIGDVCSNRKRCAIECDEVLSACFFGLEVDSDGCPKTSNCLCRSPCDEVQCPSNQLCIMRPRECREQVCLPVPTCEDNPCTNQQRPAVDARSQDHLMCNDDHKDWCPKGFYCTAYDQNRVGVCCPGKGTVCNLKLDEGSCTQASPRFYYDSESESCLQFIYTGCQGNLNNFLSMHDCQRFCVGSSMDLTRRLVDDDGTTMMDLYAVGFSLVGPMARTEKHSTDFNRAVMNHLIENYNLGEKEVRDMYTKDDNTVRFTIVAPDAKEKAENVSNAVYSGKFHFKYKGETYRAEPQTWFSKQTGHSSDMSDGGVLFWVILAASMLFALIVVVVLCCGYNFLRVRPNTDNNSIYREVSPAPYGSFVQQRNTGAPGNSKIMDYRHPINNKAISADNLHSLRATNIGGANHLLTPKSELSGRTSSYLSTASPVGNNLRTRTTLYY
uniref:Uncharacterized protein n=1 Tax=Ditylenchus dipsaci TaxID=166011 RepID=A0A915CU01_9BILA